MPDVIISYRPDDNPVMAADIADFLRKHLGANEIALGVKDLVEPGEIPKDAVVAQVKTCSVLLVFIGENWTATDWTNDDNNLDMLAITTAISQGKRIVPVLMATDEMPSSVGLNTKITSLLERSPIRIGSEADIVKLTQFLQKALPASAGPKAPAAAPVGFSPVVEKPVWGAAEAADVSQLSIEENAVVGKVASNDTHVPLHVIPVPNGETRTRVANSSHVIILGRTKPNDWLNVAYVSTTGQVIAGWLLTDNIKELNFKGQRVEPLDLPITNYEYNSKDELKELVKYAGSKNPLNSVKAWGIGCVFPILIAIVAGVIGSQIVQSRWNDGDVRDTMGAELGLIAFVIATIIATVWWYRSGMQARFDKSNKEVQELSKIMRGKTGVGSNLLSDLGKLALAAGGVAAAVGAGAIALKNNQNKHDQALASKGSYRKYDVNVK